MYMCVCVCMCVCRCVYDFMFLTLCVYECICVCDGADTCIKNYNSFPYKLQNDQCLMVDVKFCKLISIFYFQDVEWVEIQAHAAGGD